MASAVETALAGVQSDAADQIAEVTPYMIGIAGIFLVYKLLKRAVKSVG